MSVSNVGAAQQFPQLNSPSRMLMHIKNTASPNTDRVLEAFQQFQPGRMAMVVGSMSGQGLGSPELLESLMEALRNKVSDASNDEIDMVQLVLGNI